MPEQKYTKLRKSRRYDSCGFEEHKTGINSYRRTNDIIDASYQFDTEKLEQLLEIIRFSKLLPDELPAIRACRRFIVSNCI